MALHAVQLGLDPSFGRAVGQRGEQVTDVVVLGNVAQLPQTVGGHLGLALGRDRHARTGR